MIVRTNKGWTVKDHRGRSLGTYKTKNVELMTMENMKNWFMKKWR